MDCEKVGGFKLLFFVWFWLYVVGCELDGGKYINVKCVVGNVEVYFMSVVLNVWWDFV